MKTKIDLHTHTKGSDGHGTPRQIATSAKAAGLHGLCLTDHHTNLTDEVNAVADALRAVDVLPIIGCEYSTADGHLLIFGLDVPKWAWGEYPKMQDVIDDVNKLGGVCIVPHPYKGYQRALHERLETIKGLVAVESLNGQIETSINIENNRKARESAKRMGVGRTGASDAHFPQDIGVTYTEFDGAIPDEQTFLTALRSGKFCAKRDEALFQKATAWKTARNEKRRDDARYLLPPPAPQLFSYEGGYVMQGGRVMKPEYAREVERIATRDGWGRPLPVLKQSRTLAMLDVEALASLSPAERADLDDQGNTNVEDLEEIFATMDGEADAYSDDEAEEREQNFRRMMEE